MINWSEEQQKYMKLALELAEKGSGNTSPNPMVGAVLVKNNGIIGMGWHKKCGGHHAEVEAFHSADDTLVKGADMYVTLEPCSHYGKTPPCAEALIQKGVGRVFVAMEDPNPLVAGRGIKMLRDSGIEVEVGLMADEARRLNEIFLHYIQTRTPFVAIKTAMTLDGKICTKTGASKWITGPESRARVHELRNRYSAILVGAGTVVADDPSLTTRLVSGMGRHPLRVILDSQFRSSIESKVFKCTDDEGHEVRTLLITTAKAAADKLEAVIAKGVEVYICQRGKIEVEEVLKVLSERNLDSLLIEGGSEINASFLEAGLVQKIYAFIAPKILGGISKGPIGGEGKNDLAEAWELENIHLHQYGNDLLVEGDVKRGEPRCSQV